MFKMVVHVTQEFETEAEAKTEYDEIRGDLVRNPNLHFNCQITKKFPGFSPENPDGHGVES